MIVKEKYKVLNDDAYQKVKKVIEQKAKDKDKLEQCYKELDILYNKSILFLIYHLYLFIKDYKIKLFFKGRINNLLILYVLGLNNINPTKYNLSSELYYDNYLSLDLIGESSLMLFWYLEKQIPDFRIFEGGFKETKYEQLNELLSDHYLIVPYIEVGNQRKEFTLKRTKYGVLKTIEDYRDYTKHYIIIRIGERDCILDKGVYSYKNVINDEFFVDLEKKLKPKTIEEYAKIVALGHGARVWNDNQDKLFEQGKINIKNVIATREDIYEYLLERNIDQDTAISIIKFIHNKKDKEKKKEYIEIMKKHNCEQQFISVIMKMKFVFGRGQALAECLFYSNKENYYKI